MMVDNTYLYILHGGILFRYEKSSLNACGTPLAGVMPSTCPPTGFSTPTGAGPCPTGVCPANAYPTTVGPTSLSPSPIAGADMPSGITVDENSVYVLQGGMLYRYDKNNLSACGTIIPQAPVVPYAPFGSTCPPIGAGPCPSIQTAPTPSSQAQATINCLSQLCGPELDKSYLLTIMQLQPCIIALSQPAISYATRTSLQNFALNSMASAQATIDETTRILNTQFCLDLTVCAPTLATEFDICKLAVTWSPEQDAAYKSQIIQYYVDEIAVSQVYALRGQDAYIKELACRIIKHDRRRIDDLRHNRCGLCL
jgi:hypothetical protein